MTSYIRTIWCPSLLPEGRRYIAGELKYGKGKEILTEKVLEKWALFCYARNVSTYNLLGATVTDDFGHGPSIKEKRKRDGRFNTVSEARNYSGS